MSYISRAGVEEITGWKRNFYNNFEKKYGAFLTEEQVRLRSYILNEIASAVEARETKIGEHILAIGHNDECMFCGFKDKFATSIINPSKE